MAAAASVAAAGRVAAAASQAASVKAAETAAETAVEMRAVAAELEVVQLSSPRTAPRLAALVGRASRRRRPAASKECTQEDKHGAPSSMRLGTSMLAQPVAGQ